VNDLNNMYCLITVIGFCKTAYACRGCLALRLGQHYVQEIAGRRNGSNSFEASCRHRVSVYVAG